MLYLWLKVVQHNNICFCTSCLSGLFQRAALHLNLIAEATYTAGSFYSLGEISAFLKKQKNHVIQDDSLACGHSLHERGKKVI